MTGFEKWRNGFYEAWRKKWEKEFVVYRQHYSTEKVPGQATFVFQVALQQNQKNAVFSVLPYGSYHRLMIASIKIIQPTVLLTNQFPILI